MNRRSSELTALALVLAGLLGFASPASAQQQPGPPPPPPAPGRRPPPPSPPPPFDRAGVADQISRTERDLTQRSPVGTAGKEIFSEANGCLERAQKQLAQNQVFTASRLAGAAEVLAQALDRLQHRDAPTPPPSPGQDLRGHLIEVYFRVRQADYFSQQFHDNGAKPLPDLARRFYEQARQAFDKNQQRQAKDYAGAAEDMVQALEFLAQAAVGATGPPPLR